MALVEARNLVKTYLSGERELKALDGVSFDIEGDEFVAIIRHNQAHLARKDRARH